jgi:hypothetical protein
MDRKGLRALFPCFTEAFGENSGHHAVNVRPNSSMGTQWERSWRYPLPAYTLTSVKVIMFDRNVANQAMICTAAGRTRLESAAMVTRFLEAGCS